MSLGAVSGDDFGSCTCARACSPSPRGALKAEAVVPVAQSLKHTHLLSFIFLQGSRQEQLLLLCDTLWWSVPGLPVQMR